MTQTKRDGGMSRVALISTPWPMFNRPSLQLGALSAYLTRELPGVETTARHIYLDLARRLGTGVYRDVSRSAWMGEALYAALCFPQERPEQEKVFHQEAKRKGLGKHDFPSLVRTLEEASEEALAGLLDPPPEVAGFSLTYAQLFSSLFFIRRLKAARPETIILAGGSLVSGPMGPGFLALSPETDRVINGEGELPLLALLTRVGRDGGLSEEALPGVLRRGDAGPPELCQAADLSRLPTPDYADYFRRLAGFPPAGRFLPVLPLEASRGCWWNRSVSRGGGRGCAFCNLNLQWRGYRAKPAERIAAEVRELTARHRILNLAFADNQLPVRESRQAFRQLAASGLDLSFFGEVRADISVSDLELLGAAGMTEVQVGIEALSGSLLRMLNKGVGVLDNLWVMRRAEELGIRSDSNLIIRFPGSTAREVEETLLALDHARPFRPLTTVPFWLGLGSPVAGRSREYGLGGVANHPNYARLMGGGAPAGAAFTIQDYRSPKAAQERLWRPVEEKVRHWREAYHLLRAGPGSPPILSLRDGGDFLVIREARLSGPALHHRLSGVSREVYLFCLEPRSLEEIAGRFPAQGRTGLVAFLDDLWAKRLVFREGDRFLSLAVRAARKNSYKAVEA